MNKLIVWVAVCALTTVDAAGSEWPSFRGPRAVGVADGAGIPTRWSVDSGENIAWTTAIPGQAHSSPIVWGSRVFVTTVVSERRPTLRLGDSGGIDLAHDTESHSWRLLALDTGDGRVVWEREAFTGAPRAKRHVKSSQSNPTPATDGETVVAIFGTQGIVAFDFSGGEKWRRDLGVLNPGLLGDETSEWGAASSPIIEDGRVFVQADRHRGSYLAAYDVETGAELWRVDREERPIWSTPTILETERGPELVVIGGLHIRGYDPATGEESWRFADESEVRTPTPFAYDGYLVLSGGYRGRPMFALRPGARGDITLAEDATSGPFVAWKSEPGGPYTSTPVAYDGLLFSVRDEGILQVHDLTTGALLHRARTDATHSASLVASDGHLFVATEEGAVLVYTATRQPELVARNEMNEICMATPAIADGTLFLRTGAHLVAVRGAAETE